MLHRNILSRIINNNVYVKLDKMYKFPERYVEYWIGDTFEEIPDKQFVKALKKKKLIAEREGACEIVNESHLDNLHVQLTDRCMCKCDHCYVGEKGKSWLSFYEMKSIIDNFIELGILSIDYTGGEPTLNPDFSRIVEYGKKKGLRQMLFTNGYIEDDLYSVIRDNIDIIQISLDGNEKYHNSFRHNYLIYQHVLKSLEYFSENNKTINLSFSLSKDNIQYLGHVKDIAQNYGANLRISPPVPVGDNTMTSNSYYKEILQSFRDECHRLDFQPQELIRRKPHCSAIEKTIYMSVEKKIYPCPLLSTEEQCIGMYNNNMTAILDGNKCVTLKKRIEEVIRSHRESVYFCPAFIFNLEIDDKDVFFGEE